MKLISEIEIKGFRSIRDIKLSEIDNFTALAGLNNAGKSNVLRALNAFFNEETDEGKYVDVDEDYFRPDLHKKKAKQIIISLTFSLPAHFNFRKGLEGAKDLLSNNFKLTKIWKRNEIFPAYYINNNKKELDLEDRKKVYSFLQLINFRYIPNRVLPVDVIKKEQVSLRDVLIRRLGKKAKASNPAFSSIRETSDALIQPMVKRFREASPDVGDIRLATPTSWSDMIFAFGYKLGDKGIETDDVSQGAGIQSLLMLETLHLIDLDYFQKFGWRQASIWAIEEPESSLHSSLEARVASFLSLIASGKDSRLQILCTTHSDLIIQYSNKVTILKKEGHETKLLEQTNPREALDKLSRAGISRWVHPLLYFPLDPIILVEGKYDANFLEKAIVYFKLKRKPIISFLEKLDETKTGGKDDMYNYIKANSQVIKSRSKDAPVIVILDWDARNKKSNFEKLFSSDDPFKIIGWPDTALNPKLGKSFRGIERSYSERLIELAKEKDMPIGVIETGKYLVESSEYEIIKKTLDEIVRNELTEDDIRYAKTFIKEVLELIPGVL
jgi:predicted ATP-dependent endonuclease of OLD family